MLESGTRVLTWHTSFIFNYSSNHSEDYCSKTTDKLFKIYLFYQKDPNKFKNLFVRGLASTEVRKYIYIYKKVKAQF